MGFSWLKWTFVLPNLLLNSLGNCVGLQGNRHVISFISLTPLSPLFPILSFRLVWIFFSELFFPCFKDFFFLISEIRRSNVCSSVVDKPFTQNRQQLICICRFCNTWYLPYLQSSWRHRFSLPVSSALTDFTCASFYLLLMPCFRTDIFHCRFKIWHSQCTKKENVNSMISNLRLRVSLEPLNRDYFMPVLNIH